MFTRHITNMKVYDEDGDKAHKCYEDEMIVFWIILKLR
jgi:hypothetical protein